MDILVAHKRAKKLIKIVLPRPKDETAQHFLYDEDNLCLYEIIQFKDDFRSWFVDNQLCSDGHYKMLTKIDPLFIFIPQLIKYAKNQFRPLGDVCSDFEQSIEASKGSKTSGGSISGRSDPSFNNHQAPIFDRLDYALSPNIKWANVCDTKQVDDELFVRFSVKNTIDWLIKKHARLMDSLQLELGPSASKATLISYALDLLDEYVHESISKEYKEAVKSQQYSGKDTISTSSRKAATPNSATSSKASTSAKRTNSSSSFASPTESTPAKNKLTAYFSKR